MEKQAEEEEPEASKEEEEAKEQQDDDDDEQYDTFTKTTLVYQGKRVKEFRVTGNLNRCNTRMIMDNITPHIEMRVKVSDSFKSVIYRGNDEIKDYSKTLDSPPSMFTSLEEIQEYIEVCEQIRLGLDNDEVWSNAYLPATKTTQVQGNYESKVIFRHVQIILVASNKRINGLLTTARSVKETLYLYTGHP